MLTTAAEPLQPVLAVTWVSCSGTLCYCGRSVYRSGKHAGHNQLPLYVCKDSIVAWVAMALVSETLTMGHVLVASLSTRSVDQVYLDLVNQLVKGLKYGCAASLISSSLSRQWCFRSLAGAPLMGLQVLQCSSRWDRALGSSSPSSLQMSPSKHAGLNCPFLGWGLSLLVLGPLGLLYFQLVGQ